MTNSSFLDEVERVPSYSDKKLDHTTAFSWRHIVSPHVDSFNYFLEYGLDAAIEDLIPTCFDLPDETQVQIHVSSIKISYPVNKGCGFDDESNINRITPREARERGLSYSGGMSVNLEINNNGQRFDINIKLGEIPIMVMSERCNLKKYDASKLIQLREEEREFGGYFIVRGCERCVRLLQVARRNHAMATERNSYRSRGPTYTDKGVFMRCVRADQSSSTVTLHYLTTGNATLRFAFKKQEFLLPVVLVAKALMNITDKELYERILQGTIREGEGGATRRYISFYNIISLIRPFPLPNFPSYSA